jgi:hypothetical protein
MQVQNKKKTRRIRSIQCTKDRLLHHTRLEGPQTRANARTKAQIIEDQHQGPPVNRPEEGKLKGGPSRFGRTWTASRQPDIWHGVSPTLPQGGALGFHVYLSPGGYKRRPSPLIQHTPQLGASPSLILVTCTP